MFVRESNYVKQSKNYLIHTKQPNMPTIQATIEDKRFYLYSKYNPIRDSEAFAEEAYDKKYQYIIECNKDILKIATENIDLTRI